ncbi:hypothetical protein Tco_1035324, partial [Tanacetum coccineum]
MRPSKLGDEEKSDGGFGWRLIEVVAGMIMVRLEIKWCRVGDDDDGSAWRGGDSDSDGGRNLAGVGGAVSELVARPRTTIKPHSPNSSRMKVVDYLTTQTPPSPHAANSHPKDVYSYYNPEMFDDDWGLESKEVSPLGEELSLFDRPNEVERRRNLEAHHLESILQQQISQRMAPPHHD